ncbi:hypothetical protein BSLA_01f0992 [Burkholderia stabilis]|nr:hypothetical protein BSLA_01f0992 [Burkholderia stabilis]
MARCATKWRRGAPTACGAARESIERKRDGRMKGADAGSGPRRAAASGQVRAGPGVPAGRPRSGPPSQALPRKSSRRGGGRFATMTAVILLQTSCPWTSRLLPACRSTPAVRAGRCA